MFAFLADHRQEVFPDDRFDDLFPSGRGRPSVPASVMASILVLQTLHDYSDRETAEAARCDLRWKVATGMALDDTGFDASTLVYWRRRLARSARPHRINDAVKQVVEQTGILAGRRKRSAVALLALVAGQDVEPAEGSDGTDGRWRIAHRVAPERVISTVDPQARHTRKSPENRRDGYRAHVSAEPEIGIITDEELTMASGSDNSDAAIAGKFVAAEGESREWYADSAYGTGDLRAVISDSDGDEAVIKPKPLRAPVDGGFTIDDFDVDEEERMVTCPAGRTWSISRTRTVTFGRLCSDCPLRARCTRSKTGRKIVLHEHDDLLRAARRDWAERPEVREKYRKFRPNVEWTICQVASRGGRWLKLRYRGMIKNHAWLSRRTAGLNLRNLVGRGLTCTAGGWALAPDTA